MKALVALCLFVAYLPGCAKNAATQRENDIDSERSEKSYTVLTKPFPSKNHPSPTRDTDNDPAFRVTEPVHEPSSSPEETDNSQFTRQQIRANRDRSMSMTKEEILARIAPRLSRSSADLPVRYGPDGEMLIDLKGRFSHVSLAKKMPDGTIRHTCVDNIKSAKAWLSARERPAKK